ncbi:MAG TPA: peptidylprolyl isomerase [Candidatus Acidoferrales bacterium]|nr:peptidylprolyl isomerase [Candidatus Acidoferrales bacterium]
MKLVRILPLALLALCLSFVAASADDAPAAAAAKPAAAKSAAAKSAKPGAKMGATDKAIIAIDAQIAAAKIDKSNPTWKQSLPMPKAVSFDSTRKYYVKLTTNKGDILIRFMPDIAPMHVTNFIYLARMGFYDGTIFHRVIPNFMAQGGDPVGNGTGGPGYGFNPEFSDKVKHDRAGLLSMANTGQPNSDGSQFFLTFVATPWLNGKHCIFGEVVEGLDVLKKLEAAGTQSGQTTEKLTLDKAVVSVK